MARWQGRRPRQGWSPRFLRRGRASDRTRACPSGTLAACVCWGTRDEPGADRCRAGAGRLRQRAQRAPERPAAPSTSEGSTDSTTPDETTDEADDSSPTTDRAGTSSTSSSSSSTSTTVAAAELKGTAVAGGAGGVDPPARRSPRPIRSPRRSASATAPVSGGPKAGAARRPDWPSAHGHRPRRRCEPRARARQHHGQPLGGHVGRRRAVELLLRLHRSGERRAA